MEGRSPWSAAARRRADRPGPGPTARRGSSSPRSEPVGEARKPSAVRTLRLPLVPGAQPAVGQPAPGLRPAPRPPRRHAATSQHRSRKSGAAEVARLQGQVQQGAVGGAPGGPRHARVDERPDPQRADAERVRDRAGASRRRPRPGAARPRRPAGATARPGPARPAGRPAPLPSSRCDGDDLLRAGRWRRRPPARRRSRGAAHAGDVARPRAAGSAARARGSSRREGQRSCTCSSCASVAVEQLPASTARAPVDRRQAVRCGGAVRGACARSERAQTAAAGEQRQVGAWRRRARRGRRRRPRRRRPCARRPHAAAARRSRTARGAGADHVERAARRPGTGVCGLQQPAQVAVGHRGQRVRSASRTRPAGRRPTNRCAPVDGAARSPGNAGQTTVRSLPVSSSRASVTGPMLPVGVESKVEQYFSYSCRQPAASSQRAAPASSDRLLDRRRAGAQGDDERRRPRRRRAGRRPGRRAARGPARCAARRVTKRGWPGRCRR